MALTLEQIVDRITGSFDVTQADALQFVNNRRSRMMSEAQFLTKITTIGSTVAGTATYDLPAGNINLRYIQIGTTRYDTVSPDDLWDIEAGRAADSTDGSTTGLVALYYSSGDSPQIKLRPAPSTTGTAINAIQTHSPSALTYATATATGLPDFIDPYLLDGGLADVYEQKVKRQDLAQLHESRYQDGISKLGKYAKSRLRPSGPYRIVVHR